MLHRPLSLLLVTLLCAALLVGCAPAAQAPAPAPAPTQAAKAAAPAATTASAAAPKATDAPKAAAPAATSAPAAPKATDAPKAAAPAAPAGGEKVYRAPSFEPGGLDPAKGGPGYQEFQNLYEPLVDAYTKDGQIKPLAAESFEASADGLTYTFKLRQGLKWSDGKDVVAEDYRYAWLRQLDPKTASYTPNSFYAIKGAEDFNKAKTTDPATVGIQAPDARTIVVTLGRPAPYFLRQVGSAAYFPVRKDIIEKFGDKWMEAGNFVGNGPYMLQEWRHDQRLVLVKNPNYNGPWKDSRKVDRIELTVMQDPWSQGVPKYEANELDASPVPANDLDRVKADAKLGQEVKQLPISGSVIMVFDTRNKPTDDVKVRQALSLAIDRNALAAQVLKGAYQPATSFSPPDLASYDKASFQAFDAAKAKQLLAEAGYPNGQGFPKFELTFWSQQRESLLAQAIKAMWKQHLNIDINLQQLEVAAMRDYRLSRAKEPFNAYLALNWSGILDPREFHNNQLDPASNVRHSRYDNADYVKLIRDGDGEPNAQKREQMYKQAEALVNRDAPIISLIYEARTWLVKPYVKGFDAVTTSVAEMTRVASPPGLEIQK